MSLTYSAKITVTKTMGDNGDVYKKYFNGTCTVGVGRKTGSIAQRADAYMKAVNKSLGITEQVVATEKPRSLRLETVQRVTSIPIVDAGLELSEKVYHRIRESNPLIRWYLSLGEKSFNTGVQMALPAVLLFEGPITQLDKFLCKSLDVVERRVPSIYLPPERVSMYRETRGYVMRRADSVKQLGTAVLDSRVTAVTAGALDRALTTADKYVDKYLPPDHQDVADVSGPDEADGGDGGRARAAQAVQHGARLRRKLQRRLTRQALAEAKAIKEQIHVLVYVAELVATDPALAWQKAKALYASLSEKEPENQARPSTVEELMVLLAREAARRLVHLINYTHTDLPKNVKQGMALVTSHLSFAAEALMKSPQVEAAMQEVRELRGRLQALLQQLQATSRVYLEHLAIFLAGNEEREKIAPRSSYEQRNDLTSINGVN
ncbi:lipid storage droplets surface-binding protein 1 isoform X3 [Plutella xylostella]|uniref:lipid storage droplets surface-binding protein 1 isoform X3 n=1 Tax=Plutella xylostella TaxID=51655 RepID=UPI0005D0A537|nr:lipid storage droplets surface-binding protein 1 isoform X3 [Plutella xylostella]